jgi:HPt (histidine-containing phosphotransfer) domain-containing protein
MHTINPSSQVFAFNQELDSDFLTQYCDDDLHFCSDVFAAFLDTCREDVEELAQAIKARNYKTISQIAHKIKPNYAIVGLSGDGEALAKLDHQAKEESISEDANELIENIRNHISIIEEDNNRLMKFLEESH